MACLRSTRSALTAGARCNHCCVSGQFRPHWWPLGGELSGRGASTVRDDDQGMAGALGRIALIITSPGGGGVGCVGSPSPDGTMRTGWPRWRPLLGDVAAVGVAVWAAVRSPVARKSVTVSATGRAAADSGGKAITGVAGKADQTGGAVRVERTGDAKASWGGDAVTSAQLD